MSVFDAVDSDPEYIENASLAYERPDSTNELHRGNKMTTTMCTSECKKSSNGDSKSPVFVKVLHYDVHYLIDSKAQKKQQQ
jgi:hypothetical protein